MLPSFPASPLSCWASPKGGAREDLPDGSSDVLGQLFQGSHTRKFQDQIRQGLQLKGDLGWVGQGLGSKCGAGWGKGKTRLQALVGH